MRILPFVLIFLLFTACADEAVVEQMQTEVLDDTIYEDLAQLDDTAMMGDGVIYTAEAAVDGPDGDLWIMQPGESDGEITDPMPDYFNILEIIPYKHYTQEFSEEMSYIGMHDFRLYGPFDEFQGGVAIYYDKDKTKLAADWVSDNGLPSGVATVYDLDGNIFIQKTYKAGELDAVHVYPYSVDWTFIQNESRLNIKDVVSDDNTNNFGEPKHRLSYSIHQENGVNVLERIMDKESFGQAFEVNGESFTGTIEGYAEPYGIEYESILFDLHFTDGWLDGDVKIYNYWGDLKLHEVFVDGELDSTIYVMDESEMDGLAKPIIYLYPEEEMLVDVELKVKGELTHTYPKYSEGWQVRAKEDGSLTDAQGQEYYALYWEAKQYPDFSLNEGFCVPGEKSAEFLERALSEIGLNRREANEFIIYWLPHLEQNAYNLIHFSTDEYESMAQLIVTPKPQTMIRVMMVYQALDEPQNIRTQDLRKLKKERVGFTVVEWGGSEVIKESL